MPYSGKSGLKPLCSLRSAANHPVIWVDHSLSPISLSSFAQWDNTSQLVPILLTWQVGQECHTCDQEGVSPRPEVSGLLWVGVGRNWSTGTVSGVAGVSQDAWGYNTVLGSTAGSLLPLFRAVFPPSSGTGSRLCSLASKCPGGTSPAEKVREMTVAILTGPGTGLGTLHIVI